MSPFKMRLVQEYKDLVIRIDKLDAEIDKAAIDPDISNEHYRLMRIQYFAMCAYEGALRARMEDLGIYVTTYALAKIKG